MTDHPRKRRGPLLWLADCFRQRPFLAVASSLLLLLLAAVSTIGTAMIVRQQRAEEQLQRAKVQLNLARQHQQLVNERPADGQRAAEESAVP